MPPVRRPRSSLVELFPTDVNRVERRLDFEKIGRRTIRWRKCLKMYLAGDPWKDIATVLGVTVKGAVYILKSGLQEEGDWEVLVRYRAVVIGGSTQRPRLV